MVKWELMPKNLAIYATVPKYKSAKREIWTAETLMHALEVCEDERLKLALNLAFSCSMRMGEMLGLTWDCVDISDEAIEEGRAFIYIDKEVQRVDKAAIQELHGKDVILVFPEESRKNKTVRVLKLPKTESSIRKVFLPKSVAEMLVEWKKGQDKIKETLGDSGHSQINRLRMCILILLMTTAGRMQSSLKKLFTRKKTWIRVCMPMLPARLLSFQRMLMRNY